MANQALEMFFKKLGENEEFAEKILQTQEKEEVQKLAKEEGIELSLEEIEQAKEILVKSIEKQNKSEELSDEELENVAGGAFCEDAGRAVDQVIDYVGKKFEKAGRDIVSFFSGW